ncbi:MAG: hypothetical protein U0183_11455 [Polyangiaceae bacterium]
MKLIAYVVPLASSVILAAALFACSSSTPTTTSDGGTDAGTSTSPSAVNCGLKACPQDPEATEAEKQACQAAVAGPCSTTYKAVYACTTPKLTCGADGKLDTGAALAVLKSCEKELEAYNRCAESTDGGSGGGDGGGADCKELASCCAKLPSPTGPKCSDIAQGGDEVRCGNVKSTYCSLDPRACTALESCCASLSGDDRATCETQITTYANDVELCAGALRQWKSDGQCN